MALPRITTWVAGQVLTAAALNAEFDNIINNPTLLVQPWVGPFDLNGNTFIWDQDGDTSMDAAVDDTIDISIAGADDFRITANTFTALSGSSVVVEAGDITVTDGVTTLNNPDSRTDSLTIPLIVGGETNDVPDSGIGSAIKFQAQSLDENPADCGAVGAIFFDVTAGAEESFVVLETRTAGAALAPAYYFRRSSGTSFGTFAHGTSSDRTWTMPDASGIVIVHGQADVATTDLKTATGSATVTATSAAGTSETTATNTALNAYSFFPSITNKETETSPSILSYASSWAPHGNTVDPADQVGRIKLTATITGDGAGSAGTNVITARWRYVTASDRPEMWVLSDPLTGKIIASWASDDPLPGGAPGMTMEGYTPLRVTAEDLEAFSILSAKATQAAEYITNKKLSMEHQAYRALQLLAEDSAPSKWILDNCTVTQEGVITFNPQKFDGPDLTKVSSFVIS